MGEIVTGVPKTLSDVRSLKKEVDLPSGKKAKIYKGKGADSVKALKDAENESSKYLVCLMASLVEIDGVQFVPEDLEELDLPDFMKLQTEFATENF